MTNLPARTPLHPWKYEFCFFSAGELECQSPRWMLFDEVFQEKQKTQKTKKRVYRWTDTCSQQGKKAAHLCKVWFATLWLTLAFILQRICAQRYHTYTYDKGYILRCATNEWTYIADCWWWIVFPFIHSFRPKLKTKHVLKINKTKKKMAHSTSHIAFNFVLVTENTWNIVLGAHEYSNIVEIRFGFESRIHISAFERKHSKQKQQQNV